MSAWIQITNDLILLGVEDKLWLVRHTPNSAATEATENNNSDESCGSAEFVQLEFPPSKARPVNRNIGNENKKDNLKILDDDEEVEEAPETIESSQKSPIQSLGTNHEIDEPIRKAGKLIEPLRLTSVHVPLCQSYVLACTSDKRLIVWARKDTGGDQTLGDQWTLHSVRETPRKCVQVRVTGQSPAMILIADRAGDVYEFPLEDAKVPPILLMGRLSMLLDMALGPADDFLVVCDRDEKIVVCHYPEAFNIIAFCLGHRQFVTSIELLPNHPNRLVSVGGDGRLILWNLDGGGIQLASADCWAEAQTVDQLLPFEQFHSRKDDKDVRPPLKKVLCKGNLIVVLYCRVPYVHVFLCNDGNSLISRGGIATEAAVWSAAIDDSLRLWVLTPKLSIFQLNEFGEHNSISISSDLDSAIHKVLSPLEDITEVDPDLDILYKQWFDNVEEYLERKKQREEIRKSKKQRKECPERSETSGVTDRAVEKAENDLQKLQQV